MEKEFSENINSESPQPFSDMEDRITENINSEVSQPGLEVAGGITENINSSPGDGTRESATDTLAELCAATIKRRGKRGRPKGVGRKHPDQCQPKTFRHFSPLAHGLLGLIRLGDPELMAQSEAEIVEEALVRLARCLSNQNPLLAKRLERAADNDRKRRGISCAYHRLRVRRMTEKVDSVIRYYRQRTKPNLIKILYANFLEGDERDVRDLLIMCSRGNKCGLYGCPNCGKRLRNKVRRETVKKIVAMCGQIPDEKIYFVRHDQRPHGGIGARSRTGCLRGLPCGTQGMPTRGLS